MNYKFKEEVSRAKEGSKEDMLYIIEELKPLIYKNIGDFRKNQDIEDLFQEASIIVMEGIKDFDEKRGIPFLGFIKSRLHFSLRNLCKEEAFHLSLDEEVKGEEGISYMDMLKSDDPNSLDIILNKEESKDLIDGLNSLSQIEKSTLIDHYLRGITFKDIAKSRKVHYKTVLDNKNRAIRKLSLFIKSPI